MRRARSEPGAKDTQGVVILDGKPVFFEGGRRPYPGEEALVILHDGTMAVCEVAEAHSYPKPGHVYVKDAVPAHPRALASYSLVPCIGAITTSTGNPKRLR